MPFFKKSCFGCQILELVSLIQNGSLICPPPYWLGPRILVDLNTSCVWRNSSWTPSQMSQECKFRKSQPGHTCKHLICNVIFKKHKESTYNNIIKYNLCYLTNKMCFWNSKFLCLTICQTLRSFLPRIPQWHHTVSELGVKLDLGGCTARCKIGHIVSG
jgi:hypothetical protein